jgi:hypothetical protein
MEKFTFFIVFCLITQVANASRLICYKVEFGVRTNNIQDWKMTYPEYHPNINIYLNDNDIQIHIKKSPVDLSVTKVIYNVQSFLSKPKSGEYFELSFICHDSKREKYIVTYRYTLSNNEYTVTTTSSDEKIVYYCVEDKEF